MVRQQALSTARRGIEIRRRLTTLFAATSILPVLLLIYISVAYVIPHSREPARFLLLLAGSTLLAGMGFILIMRTAQRLGEISRSLSIGMSSSPNVHGDGMSQLTTAAKNIKNTVDQQRQEIWQMKQQQAVLTMELHKTRSELKKNEDLQMIPGTWDIEGWQDYLSQEVERSKRYHKRFCVLYSSLPEFKSSTEALPEPERAEIARLVVEKLRGMVRNSDLVAGSPATYFGIMMPETEPDGGKTVMRRISTRFPGEAFVSRSALQGLSFDLCIGMVSYPFDARDAETIIDHAMSSLREAQKRGPGSTVIFDRHSIA